MTYNKKRLLRANVTPDQLYIYVSVHTFVSVHEQHIRAAYSCIGVVWKVNGRSPTSTRQGAKTIAEIKLQIRSINCVSMQGRAFGDLVDTSAFWGIYGANPQFWGPEIGNPIIKKTAITLNGAR